MEQVGIETGYRDQSAAATSRRYTGLIEQEGIAIPSCAALSLIKVQLQAKD